MSLRHAPVLLVPALAWFTAGSVRHAAADTVGGSEIEIELQLPDGDGGFVVRNDPDLIDFFNLANCVCGTDFAAELHLPSGDTQVTEEAEIWVGTDCDSAMDLATREQQCELITTYPDVVENLRSEQTLPISAARFMYPNQSTCGFESVTRAVYALVDDDNRNDSTFLCEFSEPFTIDTQPPPEPAEPALLSGESSLVVQWEPPTERTEDVKFYQFLCARADGSTDPVDDFPRDIDPEYRTASMVCGADDGSGITLAAPPPHPTHEDGGVHDGGMSDAGAPDAGPPPDAGPAPTGLGSLDPAFLCGTASGTETSARIGGLQNGVPYRVVMVSIDDARNPTAIDLGQGTPKDVKDFWEDYHDKGGSADGNICLVTQAFGDDHPFTNALRDFRDGSLATSAMGRKAIDFYYWIGTPVAAAAAERPWLSDAIAVAMTPLVIIATVWEQTGWLLKLALLMLVIAWRRTRNGTAEPPLARAPRPALAGAAAAIAVLCVSHLASAQSSYDPYWERWEGDDAEAGPATPRWNLELKVGPYLPQIDDEFGGGSDAPFERTFGSGSLLHWNGELQHFFLFPAGQLGVYGSLGIMGTTSTAFEVDADGMVVPDPDDPTKPKRAEGNDVAFRLMPSSLGLVYRFTALDDRFKVPLVPYGKLGLSYYLWWVRQPNGDLAEVPTADCADLTEMCDGDEAFGASIGWQATLGLALRAERLDPSAEVSLRNELGIEHAGFFFELLYANVDHFGADDRLTVGDLTWQAGITFEF